MLCLLVLRYLLEKSDLHLLEFGNTKLAFSTETSGLIYVTKLSYDWLVVLKDYLRPVAAQFDYQKDPRNCSAESWRRLSVSVPCCEVGREPNVIALRPSLHKLLVVNVCYCPLSSASNTFPCLCLA